jgi:transcriptional regulator with XRE-family HTH domain
MAHAVGRTIQVIRTDRGLSRRELAELTELSYSYLSEIENGVKEAAGGRLYEIARALGVTPSELMHDAEMRVRERAYSSEDDFLLDDDSIELAQTELLERAVHPPEERDPGFWRRLSGARRPRRGATASARRPETLASRVSYNSAGETRESTVELLLGQLALYLPALSPEDRERVVDLARRLAEPERTPSDPDSNE